MPERRDEQAIGGCLPDSEIEAVLIEPASSEAARLHVASCEVCTRRLEQFRGDRELLGELAQVFKTDCVRIIEGMRQAIAQNSPSDLEQFAHTLKGSSASLGAVGVSQTAAQLERLARGGSVEGANGQFEVLQTEIERAFCELETLNSK